MTVADVITRARERLDEDLGADSQRYTTAALTEILYQGTRFYVARTGCQYATDDVAATAFDLLYDLPCDCIQVERVSWDSGDTLYPLEATLARDLDGTTYWWQRSTDTRSRAYFLLGLRRIALWPVSADGGEDYIVHYQQDVAEDLTAVPIEDHPCIVDYVIGRCLLAEGKAEGGEDLAKYMACVEAAKRRRSNVDRTWAMSGGRIG